jgi:serine/threonine protein kinase
MCVRDFFMRELSRSVLYFVLFPRYALAPSISIHSFLLISSSPSQGKLLGKGGFAKAYWCTCLQTQKQYALKVVLKETLTKPKAKAKLQVRFK